jgi:hypothetical protein
MHLGEFPNGLEFATFVMARNNYPFEKMSVPDHCLLFEHSRATVPRPEELMGTCEGSLVFLDRPDESLLNQANPGLLRVSFEPAGRAVRGAIRIGGVGVRNTGNREGRGGPPRKQPLSLGAAPLACSCPETHGSGSKGDHKHEPHHFDWIPRQRCRGQDHHEQQAVRHPIGGYQQELEESRDRRIRPGHDLASLHRMGWPGSLRSHAHQRRPRSD